jgi:hypothetical protein
MALKKINCIQPSMTAKIFAVLQVSRDYNFSPYSNFKLLSFFLLITLSFFDVTSGLRRPLPAEIDKPPSVTRVNSNITCERYAIDSKPVLNIRREPWSLYRFVVSLPVSDITELGK